MKMNTSQEAFIYILRSGLWNRPLPASFNLQQVEWNEVLDIAMKQTVWGVVIDVINRLPVEFQPDSKVLLRMNCYLSRNRSAHACLNETLTGAVAMLRDNGIAPVLLKGQGVATYYHDATLRCCGDIDLYVGKENYDKACRAAKLWGEDEEAAESEKHYHFSHNGVTVELHRIAEKLPNVVHDRHFQKWTRDMLAPGRCRQLQFGQTSISVPPADFEVLYIFNHAYHHFLSGGGIGLRQLCDWTLALHHFYEGIDLHALEHHLKSFGLWKGWKIFGCIAVDAFGLPQNEFPFYDASYRSKSQRVLNMIYRDGNFGFYNPERSKRPDGYIAGKWHSFKNFHRRYIELFPIFHAEIFYTWVSFICTGVKRVIKDKIAGR